MFSNIGVTGVILILIVALIIFGPQKLPELGRSFGSALRQFKKSTCELTEDAAIDDRDDTNTKKGMK